MSGPPAGEPPRRDPRGAVSPRSEQAPLGPDGFGTPTLHGASSASRRPASAGATTALPIPTPHNGRTYPGSQWSQSAPSAQPDRTAWDIGGPNAAGPHRADPVRVERSRPVGPGLPGWAAILILVAITFAGGAIDNATGASSRPAFNYGFVFAALVAAALVRRRDMFSVLVAPPLVYVVGSAVMLYLKSGDGESKRSLLIDAASNWLVYGFPAIAATTAIVLVVSLIRRALKR